MVKLQQVLKIKNMFVDNFYAEISNQLAVLLFAPKV